MLIQARTSDKIRVGCGLRETPEVAGVGYLGKGNNLNSWLGQRTKVRCPPSLPSGGLLGHSQDFVRITVDRCFGGSMTKNLDFWCQWPQIAGESCFPDLRTEPS
jgi:hypothetical protein